MPTAKKKAAAIAKPQTFSHTVTFWTDQERWMSDHGYISKTGSATGLSGLVQSLLDMVIAGEIDHAKLRQFGARRRGDAFERAAAYLEARGFEVTFEEDVSSVLHRAVGKIRGVEIISGRIHKNDRSVFVATFSIENRGDVVASIKCAVGVSRRDPLQLALAEAIIGSQHTGRPVITVVPYLTPEAQDAIAQYVAMGQKCVTIGELEKVVAELLA